jgi:hypothetical protein
MAGIRTYVQSDLRVAPTEGTHLVRLNDMIQYVAGLTKEAVRAVLTTPFVGTYNGTTMTLTQTTAAALIVDGVTLAVDDRVLLAGQLDLTQNGIYVLTTLGDGTTAAVLTRAEDFNASADLVNGTIIPVSEGDDNANTRWKLTPATLPAVLDTTNLVFTKQATDVKRVVEMTFDIEGDDVETLYEFEHNLNSTNVTHEIYDSDTGDTVVAQFRRVSPNDVEVEFGVPLGDGTDFTLVIRAEVDPA